MHEAETLDLQEVTMDQMNITDSRATLERISRHETAQAAEKWSVASVGSQPLPLPIKIVSQVSYNVYSVEAVDVGSAGSLPSVPGWRSPAQMTS